MKKSFIFPEMSEETMESLNNQGIHEHMDKLTSESTFRYFTGQVVPLNIVRDIVSYEENDFTYIEEE